MKTGKALGVLALGMLAALGGCNDGESAASSVPDDATSSQRQALAALERDLGQSFHWVEDARWRTPKHLGGSRDGRSVLAPGVDSATATLTLLDTHRALFRMRRPAAELVLERAELDELGMTHVRFRQVAHGAPVVGAEVAAHYDSSGRIAAIQATYVPGLDELDVTPVVGVDAAILAAKEAVRASFPTVVASDLEIEDPKLVVFAYGTEPPRLAREQTVRGPLPDRPGVWIVTVDAKTGAVIEILDNLQAVKATSTGSDGKSKTFEVTASGSGYVMSDISSGVSIQTYTAKTEHVLPGELVASASLDVWDRVEVGAGAAVDAHTFANVVHDYYLERHRRNGIDGVGGPMISTVHYGKDVANAYWNGRGMYYGDGNASYFPFSAAIDIVAHEFTHGVTQATSALAYRDQSGALNEANSDIVGTFVRHHVNPADPGVWLHGHDASRTGTPGRDLENPRARNQPAAMSQYVNTTQDNGGVHYNSGIINNAAFLMTMGGANPTTKVRVSHGIGWEKSEKLWYRANTKYFLKNTDFGQAAVALLTAATDLGFSANESAIVECAFKAVGILDGACAKIDDPTPPPSSRPDAGADAAPAPVDVERSDSGANETLPEPRTSRPLPEAESAGGCQLAPVGAAASDGPSVFALVAAASLLRRRRR